MHIYIPLWICWTGGVATVLVLGVVIAVSVAAGIAEGGRDIEAILGEPYPDPREAPSTRDQL